MGFHKFKIGQSVHFSGGPRYSGNVQGMYKIVRLLPSSEFESQYRIQSVRDRHERVVRESELEPS